MPNAADTDSRDQFGLLMTGGATVDEVLQAIQESADAVKADDTIPKYTREA